MQEAFDKANLNVMDISAVAVTIGPGLSLCLRGNYVLPFPYPFFRMYDSPICFCRRS